MHTTRFWNDLHQVRLVNRLGSQNKLIFYWSKGIKGSGMHTSTEVFYCIVASYLHDMPVQKYRTKKCKHGKIYTNPQTTIPNNPV